MTGRKEPSLEQQALMGAHLVWKQPKPARQPWLGSLCVNRDYFRDTIFLCVEGMTTKAYLFLYATQQPYMACFSPLQEVPQWTGSEGVSVADWVSNSLEQWAFMYSAKYMTVLQHQDLGPLEAGSINVLPRALRLGGGVVVSRMEAIPFQSYVAGLPAKAATITKGSGSPKRTKVGNLDPSQLERFPWLAAYAGGGGSQASASGQPAVGQKAPEEASSGEEDAEELDDQALEEVFKALQDARQEWVEAPGHAASDFYCAITGGAWVQQQKGTPYDFFMGKASHGAERWCKTYGLQMSARFSIKLYGEFMANLLSRAWCHRMQHYFDIAGSARVPGYSYKADDHESYVEPSSFSEAVPALEGQALARAMGIRSIRPGEPSHG